MSTTDRDDSLSRAEGKQLGKLEAMVRRGLDTHIEVAEALTEIRDARLHRGTHETFEAYLRERWALGGRLKLATLSSEGSDAPLKVWRQALREFGRGVTAADIRLTIHKRELPEEQMPGPAPIMRLRSNELLGQLRWLLTQAAGTVANAAHQLETRAAEVDDAARAHLLEDVLVLDEELATLKALLVPAVDWNAECGRLLAGEIPPFEDEDKNEENE